MAFVDYYKVMGIDRNTPQSEIKPAFKRRVKQFHTDLNPDDPKATAKTQKLNEAYEVLNDPKKRELYDRYGENWKMYEKMGGDPFGGGQGPFGAGHNPFGGGHNPFGGGDPFGDAGFDIGDIIGGMFGGNRGRSRRTTQKPEPTFVEVHAVIDVWTAMLGGELIADTGYGKYKLKVPAGTQPGKKMKLTGKGGVTSTGVARDLIIVVDVKVPESLTERQRKLVEEARMA